MCATAHAHSYNLYGAQGLLKESSFKKKSVSGGIFIRGKSVKEELRLIRYGYNLSLWIKSFGWT